MNLRRGFRRIALVLSLVVALIAGILSFVTILETWESEHFWYSKQKNHYEDITNFWLVWDADGWTDGRYEIVRNLLNSEIAQFDFGNGIVYLYVYDVFPGIHEDMLSVPLPIWEEKAQTAKENAIQNARKQMKQHEWWGEKRSSEIILLGTLAALVGAAVGYLGAWVVLWFGGMALYKFGSKFIRWLVQGFRDNTPEQVEKVEPIHKMKKIKQILKNIFMPQAAKKDERFSKIAKQIAERHNKYGVTLTDPRTGKDLLAGMTEEQRKKYIEFKKKDA